MSTAIGIYQLRTNGWAVWNRQPIPDKLENDEFTLADLDSVLKHYEPAFIDWIEANNSDGVYNLYDYIVREMRSTNQWIGSMYYDGTVAPWERYSGEHISEKIVAYWYASYKDSLIDPIQQLIQQRQQRPAYPSHQLLSSQGRRKRQRKVLKVDQRRYALRPGAGSHPH